MSIGARNYRRPCDKIVSLCALKSVLSGQLFISDRAPIPPSSTNEEGRILACLVNSSISYLFNVISFIPLQKS